MVKLLENFLESKLVPRQNDIVVPRQNVKQYGISRNWNDDIGDRENRDCRAGRIRTWGCLDYFDLGTRLQRLALDRWNTKPVDYATR